MEFSMTLIKRIYNDTKSLGSTVRLSHGYILWIVIDKHMKFVQGTL